MTSLFDNNIDVQQAGPCSRRPSERARVQIKERQEQETLRVKKATPKQTQPPVAMSRTSMKGTLTQQVRASSFSSKSVALPAMPPIHNKQSDFSVVARASLHPRAPTHRVQAPQTMAPCPAPRMTAYRVQAEAEDDSLEDIIPVLMADLDAEEAEHAHRVKARGSRFSRACYNNDTVKDERMSRSSSSQGLKRCNARSLPTSDDEDNDVSMPTSLTAAHAAKRTRYTPDDTEDYTSMSDKSLTASAPGQGPPPLPSDGTEPEDNEDHLIPPERHTFQPGRVNINHYHNAEGTIHNLAVAYFIAYAITHNIWADDLTLTIWAKEAWDLARRHYNSRITYDNAIIGMMKKCVSTSTGKVKELIAPLVSTLYGFNLTPDARAHAHNKKRAKFLLKDFNMTWKNVGSARQNIPASGMYEHPILQAALNAIWFKGPRQYGRRFPKQFKPLPIPALALLWTAVVNCLDEWAVDGKHQNIDFAKPRYLKHLKDHIANLEKFQKVAEDAHSDMFERWRDDILIKARTNANASDDEDEGDSSAEAPGSLTLCDSIFINAINVYRSSSSASSAPASEQDGSDQDIGRGDDSATGISVRALLEVSEPQQENFASDSDFNGPGRDHNDDEHDADNRDDDNRDNDNRDNVVVDVNDAPFGCDDGGGDVRSLSDSTHKDAAESALPDAAMDEAESGFLPPKKPGATKGKKAGPRYTVSSYWDYMDDSIERFDQQAELDVARRILPPGTTFVQAKDTELKRLLGLVLQADMMEFQGSDDSSIRDAKSALNGLAGTSPLIPEWQVFIQKELC
ncbi:hypothetical protein CONPUDRAFT_155091 [Coniophora puteana RWD-64-598 SS2]|uniref:DUF6532 domain-containing protein n=1 Tax=Coniophora puteana (strain RWD-64-598) TaxID=741705 RepID=A0A5M3MKV5_CONPW|nr:uncharacterized protein CONPUDRAFT_155091 [Coniophora puteana RWD-64-598 SS2]EIW79696.1 hypothetical protein CONPUDRAFT_155091 [Coniophora puteana RWD-64-598 SS2]